MQVSRQFDKAVAALEAAVVRAAAEDGHRLPTTAALARASGVSVVTMSRAIRRLKEQGRVVASPRSGIIALQTHHHEQTSHTLPSQAAGPRLTRWERLCAQLEQSLLFGDLASRELLPPVSELARRFGVDYRTMRKTVDAAVDRGYLYPYQRTYRMRPLSSGRAYDRVVLIATANQEGGLRLYSPRTQETIRTLEIECARSEVSLSVIAWRTDATRGVAGRCRDALGRHVHDGSALGFMIWSAGLHASDVRQILGELQYSGRPVALLDEDADIAPGRLLEARQGLRIFTTADSIAAGAAVGRYLLSLGHRRIAYLSPVHGSSWSQRRLRGIEQACEQAAISDAVSRHVLPRFRYRTQFLTDDPVRRTVVERLVDDCISRPPLADDVTTGTLRDLREQILPAMKRHMLHEKLLPLFDEALASGATAWASATDEVALEAHTYLQRKGVSIPRDISVTGFDDSLEAFLHGLTSFNFNTGAAICPMLNYLLAPRTGSAPRRLSAPLPVHGFVNCRATSARAPASHRV